MNIKMIAAAVAALVAVPALAAQHGPGTQTRPGEIRFWEEVDFDGDDEAISRPTPRVNFSLIIRSISVHPGDRWQICAEQRFRDPCIILDRSVRDAREIGIQGGIGSIRPAPAQTPAQ